MTTAYHENQIVSARELWKKAERFPEFEVSNLGRVRETKTGTLMKPYWVEHENVWRVNLKSSVQGLLGQLNLANLVAEVHIRPRKAGIEKVVHINGNKTDCNATNLRYESRAARSDSVTRKAQRDNIIQIDPPFAAQAAQEPMLPQYAVIGEEGELILTTSVQMARVLASVNHQTVYELKRQDVDGITLWMLGDKLN